MSRKEINNLIEQLDKLKYEEIWNYNIDTDKEEDRYLIASMERNVNNLIEELEMYNNRIKGDE